VRCKLSIVGHQLAHRSAGSAPVNVFDLDWNDSRILACIRVASGPVVYVPIAVKPLRHRDRSRHEFAIVCISSCADRWAIEHGVYDAHLPAPHPLLPAMSLLLTHVPVNIAKRLSEL